MIKILRQKEVSTSWNGYSNRQS